MRGKYRHEPRPVPLLSDDGWSARLPLRNMHRETIAYVTVDASDAEWLNQWNWCLDRDGYAVRGDYNGGKPTTFKIHRVILGLENGEPVTVDHISRDRLDCRRANLRKLTKGANAQNTGSRPGSSSAYRGVTWSKGKWQAQAFANGRMHYFGRFDREEDAAEAARVGRARIQPYATG